MRNDDTRQQLFDQIRVYQETLFSREHQQTVLTLIDQMQALVTGFGVPSAVSEIDSVRQQLRLAESAGYIAAGRRPGNPVYILKPTPVPVCMPAIPSRFRQASPLQ
jgi:hypothetical protein